MAAELDATGILFSDGTRMDSIFDIIPQNSVQVFYQSSAPTYWTQVTTQNNKALRLVSGTGGPGQGGGTQTFTSAFPSSKPLSGNFPISGSVGNHTLTSNELPNHTHNHNAITLSPGGGDVRSGTGWSRSTISTGPNTTNASSHDHPFSGGTASYSATLDLSVQYIDVILCNYDGP